MTPVYHPGAYDNPFDPALCAAPIWKSRMPAYQCQSRGRLEEEGHLWCRVHAPSAERARQDATGERYDAESAERDRKYAIAKARARVVEAAKAWAQPWLNPDAARIAMPMQTDALVSAIAELERLEAEVQP